MSNTTSLYGGSSLFFTTFTRVRRSEEHTSDLQSRLPLVCRLLLAHPVPMTEQYALSLHDALPISLTDPLACVGEPGAALVDDVRLGCEVDEISFARHALSIEDVELDLFEWRSELVLHDLHARAKIGRAHV